MPDSPAPTPRRSRRAAALWLRDPERALALLGPPARISDTDGLGLSVAAWLLLIQRRDEAAAEAAARRGLAAPAGDTRLASAALAELLARRGEHARAAGVLEAAHAKLPHQFWYVLSIADELAAAGETERTEALLEAHADHPRLRRHVLKRLSQQALQRGDRERARRWFRELVDLPRADQYIVYASDYLTFGDLLRDLGAEDEAREIYRRGAEIYLRNAPLRERLAALGETVETPPPSIPPVDEAAAGVRRIPVRTPYINARTDMVALIEEATRDVREPGDVVVLAESPAANGQGRVVSLELVEPSPLAERLCRYVGAIGPLHSPEGMEGAIMVAGRGRVIAGAVAGAAGKLARRRGWFYRVAGPQTAMIDDVAAAVAPYDHHLLPGPADPDGLAERLAAAVSSPAAIVDANHLTGAWVVGASAGIDREWLAAALADNPAGNEDERTPVVLVRRLGGAAAA